MHNKNWNKHASYDKLLKSNYSNYQHKSNDAQQKMRQMCKKAETAWSTSCSSFPSWWSNHYLIRTNAVSSNHPLRLTGLSRDTLCSTRCNKPLPLPTARFHSAPQFHKYGQEPENGPVLQARRNTSVNLWGNHFYTFICRSFLRKKQNKTINNDIRW